MPVVIVDGLAEGTVGNMQHVLGVVILPEPMMNPVQADVDVLEIVPRLSLQKMTHHAKLSAAHREDLIAKPALVIGPEALDIDGIVGHQPANLLGKLRGMCEDIAICIRRQEAAYGDPVDATWRITRWHTDDDGPFALASELVPDGQLRDRSRVDDSKAPVGMVDPVAKTIDTERSGVLAGRQTHPGRDGDRGNHALEATVRPRAHQLTEIG